MRQAVDATSLGPEKLWTRQAIDATSFRDLGNLAGEREMRGDENRKYKQVRTYLVSNI